MISQARRLLAVVLIASIAGVSLPVPAQAAMVGTDQVLANDVEPDRQRVASLLERTDVRARLIAYGVNPADVQARVAAMTDEEAGQLAAKIDALPAGGVGVIGAIVLVFLVLLLTDILGLTKIFPFTRPVR